jgi:hypothetical protein
MSLLLGSSEFNEAPVIRYPQAADRKGMSSERDTYVLETSVGDLTIDWAWNEWVTVSPSGMKPARSQVGRRKDLTALLVEAGVPPDEAKPAAQKAWRARPSSAVRSGEAEPWGSPWKKRPWATLAVVLLGLAAMGLCIYWLKVSWVAV